MSGVSFLLKGLALTDFYSGAQEYVPFTAAFLSCQGASLFESGQSPSSLVGGIMHRTLQDRHTATSPIRLVACLQVGQDCAEDSAVVVPVRK
jgi:hypothetical protein